MFTRFFILFNTAAVFDKIVIRGNIYKKNINKV